MGYAVRRIHCTLSDVIIYDAASGAELARVRGAHSSAITRLALSPDGARLATVGLDGSTRLWDTATSQTVL
nr:hypothetical protein [Anaerolineae bacterium]